MTVSNLPNLSFNYFLWIGFFPRQKKIISKFIIHASDLYHSSPKKDEYNNEGKSLEFLKKSPRYKRHLGAEYSPQAHGFKSRPSFSPVIKNFPHFSLFSHFVYFLSTNFVHFFYRYFRWLLSFINILKGECYNPYPAPFHSSSSLFADEI